MGHFDPLVPQTIIGWKPPDEIKCSKRTLDHKGAKGHFDTLDAALQVVILVLLTNTEKIKADTHFERICL